MDEFLAANSDAYEWLVREINARGDPQDPETTLRRIEAAAQFAATSHTGRFADGAIENLALDIGGRLEKAAQRDVVPTSGERRRVLHYIDRAQSVGGHTRFLAHWVREDSRSRPCIILASQADIPVPGWLEEAVRAQGGEIFTLPETRSYLAKALRLRQLARRHADLVVLHHGAWDVLPVLAFAVTDLPPVAVLNHADHMFWLGSSVADIIIDLRSASNAHSACRRFARRSATLPVPIGHQPASTNRPEVRRKLGMAEDEIVLLSVGRAEKYRPCGRYDFPRTVGQILESDPRANLYVVGESRVGIARHTAGSLHPRLHFVGEMEDPSAYRTAADIYLESFPFGSQTALLEAALAGLPVVPAPQPLCDQMVANDDALWQAVSNPADEQDYVRRAVQLVREAGVRETEGARARKSLLASNVGAGWLRKLDGVYAVTDTLMHAPKPIPASRKLADKGDLGLCLWQVMSGRSAPAVTLTGGLPPSLTHGTFARQRVGDYRAARRSVLEAITMAPCNPAAWHLLVFALRSHVGAVLRHMNSDCALPVSDLLPLRLP